MDISITQASVDWLRTLNHLSPTSQLNYRGEIDRFAQFVASRFKLLNLSELRIEHWEKYVQDICISRRAIASRRVETLRPSSAVQAIRICRKFLIWCASEGMLRWLAPRFATAKSKPKQETHEGKLSIPAVVRSTLVGRILPATPEDLRAVLAINLAYWGALGSSDLALLKARSINTGPDVHLCMGDGKRNIALPSHVGRLWRQYKLAREKFHGVAVTGEAPLLSQIHAERPMHSWSIWSTVKEWQMRQRVENCCSPQKLRAAFLQSISVEASAVFAAVVAHAGNAKRNVDGSRGNASIFIRRMQRQEMQRLAA